MSRHIIKYCSNFSNSAELRYLQYLVIVPNITCLHPKDLVYIAAPANVLGKCLGKQNKNVNLLLTQEKIKLTFKYVQF